ncbi:MAG: fibronectin type III domain-containing protein [Candidatus Aphodosoma sp.]
MKRTIYTLLLCLLILFGYEDIGAQTVYLEEGFESSSMPSGWTVSGTNSGTYNWNIFTSNATWTAHSGNGCLRADSYYTSAGNTNIISSPAITVGSTYAKLTFWVKNQSGGKMGVYISTDGGATYLNNPLDTNLVGISNWTKKEYSLSNYNGQSIKIVFHAVSNCNKTTGGYQFIDDIKIYIPPTCAQPTNLKLTSKSNHNATIRWGVASEGDSTDNYTISVYDIEGDTYIMEDQEITTTDESYSISGLTSNTKYRVSLTADCSDNYRGISATSTFTFTTLCDAQALPIYYDFNDDTPSTVPECWTVQAPSGGAAEVSNTFKYGTEGYSFKLLNTVSAQVQAMTLPIAHAGNDIQVEFMALGGIGTPIKVGLMSDPNDFSSFDEIFVDTLDVRNLWVNYRFNTIGTQYGTTQNLYLCFVVTSGVSYSLYLDDIKITEIPSCPRLEDVKIFDLDSTSFSIKWTEYKSTPTNNYIIELTNMNDSSVSYINATTNPFTLNETNCTLVPQTTYKIRVCAVCGANDTSEWSMPVSNTTRCGVYSLPFFESFYGVSGIPECWYTACTQKGWGTGGGVLDGWRINTMFAYAKADWSIYAPTSKEGTRYLLSLPAIHIPEDEEYELDFWMHRIKSTMNAGEHVNIYVNDKMSLEGAILIDSIDRVVSNYPVEVDGPKMYEYFFNIPMTGNVFIMFESVHKYQGAMYIDEISVAPKIKCRNGISKVGVRINKSEENANITWYTRTSETQWLVDVTLKDASGSILNEVSNILVDTTFYAYNYSAFVTPNTKYTVTTTVRGLCNGVDTATVETSNTASSTFTTPCEPYTQLPVFEGFETATVPSACWTMSTDPNSVVPTTQWAKLVASYANSGQGAIRYPTATSRTVGYLNSPGLQLAADKEYEVIFDMYRNHAYVTKYSEGISVWISTCPDDTTNATRLIFIPREKDLTPVVTTVGYYNYSASFTPDSAGVYYIIFEAIQDGGNEIRLDNIIIQEKTTCVNIANTDITVEPEATFIEVTINDVSVNFLEVVIADANAITFDSIKPTDIYHIQDLTTPTNKFTMNGLEPETDYNLYFRHICDTITGEKSAWSYIPISFSTACAPVEVLDTLEFIESFESYAINSNLNTQHSCLKIFDLVSFNHILNVKGSLGQYLYQAGTQCPPIHGTQQIAITAGSDGKVSKLLHLHAGISYEVSVYARTDKAYTAKVSDISLFYMGSTAHEPIYVLEHEDANSGVWECYKGYFSVPADGNYYVGMEYYQSGNPTYFVFDYLRVREIKCAPPTNNEVIDITDTELTVEVTNNSGSTEIRICSDKPEIDDMDPETVYIRTTAETAHTVTGLQPNTVYYFIARSVCSEGVSDWCNPIEFSTQCTEYDLPFNTSFEDDKEVKCWRSVNSYTGDLGSTTGYSKVGERSMAVVNTTAISPKINVDTLGNCMLSGWVFTPQSAESQIEIAVMLTPNDVSTYETLGSINVKGNEWQEFSFYFDALKSTASDFADAKHIVISTGGTSAYYFDDIIIDYTPTCIRPNNIIATTIDHQSVEVKWDSKNSETEWKVTTYKFENKNLIYIKDTIVTADSVVISGLTPITTYSFGINAICSGNDTSWTAYSNNAKTECGILSLPYISKFGTTVPECWTTYNSTNTSTSCGWSYSVSSLYWSNYRPGTPTDTCYLESPEYRLRTNNGVYLRLDAIVSQYARIRYSTDGWVTYDSIDAMTTGSARNTYEYFISNAGPGTISFRFFSTMGNSVSFNIFGIEVEEIEDCRRPSNVTFDVNNNTVTVTIEDNVADHTEWEYVIDKEAFDPDSKTPITVNSKTFNISNLSYSLNYIIYVRTKCSSETSSWFKPYTFNTPCGVTSLPYHQTFDDIATKADILNECFTFYSENPNNRDGQLTGTANYPTVSLYSKGMYSYNNDGKSIAILSCPSYAMYMYLPEIEIPVNNTMVSFYYTNQNENVNNPKIEVGVMLPNNPESFIKAYTCPIKTGNAANNHLEVDMFKSLPVQNYTNYRIAFRYGTNQYNHYSSVDEIMVTAKEKCAVTPTLALENHSSTTMDVIASYFADSLEIKYCYSGNSINNAIRTFNTTEHYLTIANLAPATNYDFYIRNICNDEVGDWSGPFTLSTSCDTITVDDTHSYVEDFEDIDTTLAVPQCIYVAQKRTVNGITYPCIKTVEVITDSSALHMNGDNMIILPPFSDRPNSYWLSFYSKGYGKVQIGITDDIDANSFELDTTISVNNNVARYDIDLSYYSNSGSRIAIKTSGTSNLYLDSLTVYKKYTCYNPRALKVIEVEDTTAKAICNLSDLTIGFEYILMCNLDTTNYTVTGKATEISFLGLHPNTDYTFAIRSFCSDNDTSDWSMAGFKTARMLSRAPLSIDFENDIQNTLLFYANGGTNYFITGSDADAVKDGNKALYVTNDGINYWYARINTYTYAMLPMELVPGTYTVDYDWKAVGAGEADYARVFLAPESLEFKKDTWVSGLGYITLPANCTALDGGSKLNLSNEWQHKSESFTITETTRMNVVFHWRNTGYGSSNTPLAIDNLVINRYDCGETIESVNLLYAKENEVRLAVNKAESLHDSVRIELYNTNDSLLIDSIYILDSDNTLLLNRLTEDSEYHYTVYCYCDLGSTAPYKGTFRTLCNPITIDDEHPFFEGFETCSDSTLFTTLFGCWKYTNIIGTGNIMSLSANATGVGETAYEGDQALKLASNNEKSVSRNFRLNQGSYEVSLYAVQTLGLGSVNIYMRRIGDTDWTLLSEGNVNSTYTLMSATFNVPETDDYEFTINLNTRSIASGYLAIDNLSLHIITVPRPTAVNISNIATDGATIQWEGSTDDYRIHVIDVANSELIIDTLAKDTTMINISGLEASTTYIVSVRSVISNIESDSLFSTFTTKCNPLEYYVNLFDNEIINTRPECWTFEAYNACGEIYNMAEGYLQWEVGDVDGHRGVFCQNSEAKERSRHILTSPDIIVTEQSWLNFDYFINAGSPINSDSLIVSIEKGSGSDTILLATYKTVSSGWKNFNYDMSAYIGDTIAVKFSTRASSYSSYKYVGFDNFRLNCRMDGDTYYTTVCPNESYSGYGFNITAQELTKGDTTTFKRFGDLTDSCDSIITLCVYVPNIARTEIYDTICEGDVYNKGSFQGLTNANMYTKTISSSYGCDSILILYLAVINPNATIEVNLCEGNTYNFGNQVITTAGIYTDTAVSRFGCDSVTTLTVNIIPKYYETTAYFCEGTTYKWNDNHYTTAGRYQVTFTNTNGCDSIEVLNLLEIATNTYMTANICAGQEYEFFGNVYSEAGEYTHRLANSLGCDSIINLTLSVSDAPHEYVSDYVCEGQEYNYYGFSFKKVVGDTVVSRTIKTFEGCDSIVTLTLDYIPTVHDTIYATINEGEIIEFAGNTLSTAGTYEHTFHTADGCDSIVTFILDVITAMETGYALPIIMAPNPISGGQQTIINREWTATEQDGLRVEVLNTVGQIVETFTPATYPIEVGGIYTSGVYYIRITTGTGDVYLGRLVVK